MKKKGKAPMIRAAFMTLLHNQLLQVKSTAFEDLEETPTPTVSKRRRVAKPKTSGDHHLELVDDWTGPKEKQKRRQRACKVCALLRTDVKVKARTCATYCERCSIDDAKLHLCAKPSPLGSSAKTCFQVWHEDWACGTSLPSNIDGKMQMRRPRKPPGQRKKTRRELTADEDAEY
jgi:hypothetical protein